MKKIIATSKSNTLVELDIETLDIQMIPCSYAGIDYVYKIDRECTATINGKEIEMKEGDIIFRLYPIGNGDYRFIVVNNREFCDYILEKEVWEKNDRIGCGNCNKSCGEPQVSA